MQQRRVPLWVYYLTLLAVGAAILFFGILDISGGIRELAYAIKQSSSSSSSSTSGGPDLNATATAQANANQKPDLNATATAQANANQPANSCRVIKDYDYNGVTSLSFPTGSNIIVHQEFWWHNDQTDQDEPEREMTISGGDHKYNKVISGHVWIYQGCSQSYVDGQVDAHIKRRQDPNAVPKHNNDGWASPDLIKDIVKS